MGDDSQSRARGFESRRRILDEHFFTLICRENCIVCLKKSENNRKRCRGCPIIIKKCNLWDVHANSVRPVLETILVCPLRCFSAATFRPFYQKLFKSKMCRMASSGLHFFHEYFIPPKRRSTYLVKKLSLFVGIVLRGW